MNITDSRKQHRVSRRVQQKLRKNPYDIEALFELAVMLGIGKEPDLDQKRKVLHRILAIEPNNQKARQMLLDLDRAEIGGNPSRLSLAVILTNSTSSAALETPLTLRYSIMHQILVSLFIVCTLLFSLSIAQDAQSLAVVGALFLFLIIPLWFVSVVIEISDAGLRVSRLFGLVRWDIRWREVRECKPTALGKGIRIITYKDRIVEVSAQVNGYPFILDILQQMRPDLFEITEGSRTGAPVQRDPTVTPLAGERFK